MDEQEINKLFNNSSQVAVSLKNNILNNESFLEILKRWKIPPTQKFITILGDICQKDLPDDVKKNYFLSEIVHNMMILPTEAPIRDILVEVAFMFCEFVSITDLSPNEHEVFLKEIYSKYIPAISQLRDTNYQNWHKLWIFLVRFCAKKIHESMDLTNRLLRIVEYAFRNSSQDQRLKGYDCWKELIDNASLNPSHMYTKKQIKLLVTPLKAKFSKQEVVICKRFDIFVYLLEKLEQKALLCLPEFLEFCFGQISDIKDSPRPGQAKNVPQIWERSTNILLSILGHSHDYTDCISENSHIHGPLLNKENFHDYHKIVIHSIGECCRLLKGNDLNFKRHKVITCMWKSLFKLILSISEERITYFAIVADILDSYIQQGKENQYFKNLLMMIFTTFMKFERDVIHDCVPLVLKQLLIVFLTTDCGSENINEHFKQVVVHYFSKVVLEENKVKMINVMLDCFSCVKTEDVNITNYTQMWLLLSNQLITYFSGEKMTLFMKFDEFFMWPSENLHHVDGAIKKPTVLHWIKLYKKSSGDSETKKIGILKELEKSFKNNPLTSSNIISLLSAVSQFETKFSTDFVTKLMEVVSMVLKLPSLPSEDEQKLSSLVIQYFEPSLDCYNSENNGLMIKVISNCIEHILNIHSGFKLIDHFVTFFKNSSITNQEKFMLSLKDLMVQLYDKENDSNSYKSKEIVKCLALFTDSVKEKEDKKPFLKPTGRSARIASMGKNSPTSPNRPSKVLRLFGKDPETMSPLKVKGSHLNKTLTPKKKGANVVEIQNRTTRSVLEENSQDFVPVNSEVKLELNKLNEHQKEVLKRRREDIPALYQDLSQSCSQDMFSSKSNSRESGEGKIVVETIKTMTETREISTESNIMFSETPKEAAKVVENDEKEGKLVSCELFSSDGGFKSAEDSKGIVDISEDSKNAETDCKLIFNAIYSDNRKFLTSQKDNEDPVGRKRKSELKRLKMDIVGVEKFFDTPRRTRERKTTKKTDEKMNKNIKVQKPVKVNEIDGDRENIVSADKPTKETTDNVKADTEITPSTTKKKRNKKKSNRDYVIEKTCKEAEIDAATEIKKPDSLAVGIVEKVNTPIKVVEVQTPLAVGGNSNKKKGTHKRNAGDSTPLHKSRTAKILQKLESPTKSNERLIKQRQDKMKESPKKEKPGKKNLLANLLEVHKDDKVRTVPEVQKDGKEEEFKNLNETVLKEVEGVQDIIVQEEKTVKAKGDKRKCTDDENEDIIESSQDSFPKIVPLLNSSKKKQLRLSIDKACIVLENKSVEVAKDGKSKNSAFPEDEAAFMQNLSSNFPLLNSSEKKQLRLSIDKACTVLENKSVEDDESKNSAFLDDEAAFMQNLSSNLPDKVEVINEETKDVDTTQDTTITQDSSQNEEVMAEDILTESLKDCETESSIISPEPPKKPQLTESDLIICHMDTISICGTKDTAVTVNDNKYSEEKLEPTMSFNSVEDILATFQNTETAPSPDTPVKSQAIPSSPVTAETPNRTHELLDNTMDISPITSRRNSEEDISIDIPVSKSLNFLTEEQPSRVGTGAIEELGDGIKGVIMQDMEEKDDTFEEGNSSDDCDNLDASSEADTTSVETDENQYQIETDQEEPPIQNGQVSTTINIISNRMKDSSVQERTKIQSLIQGIAHKPFLKKKGGNMSSPSALRIKKLMNNVGQKQHFQEVVDNFNENDILTFSREIPSPLAVPASSILKRKFPDTSDGEGISPCPKRKRVNFSDPCLTSKKIFIKDEYHPSLEAKRLFDVTPDRKLSDDYLKDIFDFTDNSPSAEISTETDSDIPETEPSLVMVNPMILHKSKPVFPKLVDCKDDVLVIVKRITSPMFVTALMKKLDGKNVKTIGDLAKLSESEVNRFPFKVPVVENVIKALENYYKKKGIGDNFLDGKANCSKEEDKPSITVEISKFDVHVEFKMVIQRAIREKVPLEDLASTILPHINSTNLLRIVKTNCSTLAVDALEENDYDAVLKIIVKSKGILEILKKTHEIFQDEEREEKFNDAIVEYVKNIVPLKKLFKSIGDLEVGIKDSIKMKKFQKSEIIEHCLFPLLETPKDISPYLDTLTVVQIDEIVISRLKEQNFVDFFERILKEKPLEDVKKLHENLWLKENFDSNEIVNLFQKKIQSQSQTRKKDILVQMIKFCSENLDTGTLLELHVGFLRRISSAINEK